MKKIFLLLGLLLIPFCVKAEECGNRSMSDLRKIASNVNIIYDYKIVDNKAVFTVILSNITEDIYVSSNLGYDYYYSDTVDGKLVLEDIELNKMNFKIKAVDDDCSEEVLTTKYVNFPVYNKYHDDPLCEGIEEFELCQKWDSSVGDLEYLKKQVNKYRESLVKKNSGEEEKEKQGLITRLGFLFVSYYFVIIPIIVIVCLILIIKNRKDKFDL